MVLTMPEFLQVGRWVKETYPVESPIMAVFLTHAIINNNNTVRITAVFPVSSSADLRLAPSPVPRLGCTELFVFNGPRPYHPQAFQASCTLGKGACE